MNPTMATSPALFTVDGLVGVVFLIMIAITIIGGLIACNAERVVRAVAGLIVCFVGVAGIYFFLNSPFISMMQILIYVGAVAVAISFAIMLAAPEEQKKLLDHPVFLSVHLGLCYRCPSYRWLFRSCP
jgi:NADH:ubiquinone oxidoreductase subunit 6 (subunit J)